MRYNRTGELTNGNFDFFPTLYDLGSNQVKALRRPQCLRVRPCTWGLYYSPTLEIIIIDNFEIGPTVIQGQRSGGDRSGLTTTGINRCIMKKKS